MRRTAAALAIAAALALAGAGCMAGTRGGAVPARTTPRPATPASGAADTARVPATPGATAPETPTPGATTAPEETWVPPEGEPTAGARRVLDSLPDPSSVPLPADIRNVPPPPPAPAPPPATPGACYEVQLTAFADSAKAAALADDAARRLGATTRLVAGGGLYRIRAGGCLDGAAAAALRERARAAGYPGAFLTPAR